MKLVTIFALLTLAGTLASCTTTSTTDTTHEYGDFVALNCVFSAKDDTYSEIISTSTSGIVLLTAGGHVTTLTISEPKPDGTIMLETIIVDENSIIISPLNHMKLSPELDVEENTLNIDVRNTLDQPVHLTCKPETYNSITSPENTDS